LSTNAFSMGSGFKGCKTVRQIGAKFQSWLITAWLSHCLFLALPGLSICAQNCPRQRPILAPPKVCLNHTLFLNLQLSFPASIISNDGDLIQHSGSHFGIAKYLWPFAETAVCCDDQRCHFIVATGQVKEPGKVLGFGIVSCWKNKQVTPIPSRCYLDASPSFFTTISSAVGEWGINSLIRTARDSKLLVRWIIDFILPGCNLLPPKKVGHLSLARYAG